MSKIKMNCQPIRIHNCSRFDQSQSLEPTFKLEAETLGFCMNACGVGVASDLNVKISAWVLCFCSGIIVRVLDRTFGPFIRFYTKQLNVYLSTFVVNYTQVTDLDGLH